MVRASLILLLTFGVALLLRKRSSSEKHFVWALGIALAALSPLLSAVLPVWEPPIAREMAAVIQEAGSQPLRLAVFVNAAASPFSGGLTLLDALMALWLTGTVFASITIIAGALRLRKRSREAKTGEGKPKRRPGVG